MNAGADIVFLVSSIISAHAAGIRCRSLDPIASSELLLLLSFEAFWRFWIPKPHTGPTTPPSAAPSHGHNSHLSVRAVD